MNLPDSGPNTRGVLACRNVTADAARRRRRHRSDREVELELTEERRRPARDELGASLGVAGEDSE